MALELWQIFVRAIINQLARLWAPFGLDRIGACRFTKRTKLRDNGALCGTQHCAAKSTVIELDLFATEQRVLMSICIWQCPIRSLMDSDLIIARSHSVPG